MNSFVVHGAVVLVKIVAQMPAAAVFQSAASPMSVAAGVVLSVLQRPCPEFGLSFKDTANVLYVFFTDICLRTKFTNNTK